MKSLLQILLKRVLLLLSVIVLLAGCSSMLPKPRPASAIYDIGVPKEPLTSMAGVTQGDVVIIPEAQVDGIQNNMGIVYRYTNIQDREPRQYNNARWSQHPAEMLRFRLVQHLGDQYPTVLTAEFVSSDSWVLRMTLEEFSHRISSEFDSSGVVQIRVTLGQGGHFVGQKTFRAEVPAQTVDVQGAVDAISQATDRILAEITGWTTQQIRARRH